MMPARVEVSPRFLVLLSLLVLAAASRFTGLDAHAPADREAVQMLAALDLAGSPSAFWAGDRAQNPAYSTLTALVLQVFGPRTAAARLVPAAAGVALVATATFFHRKQRGVFSLLLAGLLALSPVALSLSRTAGSSVTAGFGLALALFALLNGKPERSETRAGVIGIGLGLTLASGAAGLTGLFSLVLAGVFMRALHVKLTPLPPVPSGPLAVSAGVTILIAAGGFGMNLKGLADLASSLGTWLGGWVVPGGTAAIKLLLQFISVEPLLLVFGLGGVMTAWTLRPDPGARAASLWAGSSLLIALARVGRQPGDLIWIVLPLAWLAAHVISSILTHQQPRPVLQIVVLSSLLLVLLASAGLSITSYLRGFQISHLGASSSILYFLIGALLLMAASLLLIFGMEWSWYVVLDAGSIAAVVFTISLMIQAGWRLNFPKQGNAARLLWHGSDTTDGLDIMGSTLGNASLAASGFEKDIAVQVMVDPPPALAWALRGFTREESEFVPGMQPPVAILSPEAQTDLRLMADYYGQTFALRALPAWPGSVPADLAGWWILDEAPVELDLWVLWVRADIAGLGTDTSGVEP